MSYFSNWHHLFFRTPQNESIKGQGPYFSWIQVENYGFLKRIFGPFLPKGTGMVVTFATFTWMSDPSLGCANCSEVRNDLPYPMDMHCCSAYEHSNIQNILDIRIETCIYNEMYISNFAGFFESWLTLFLGPRIETDNEWEVASHFAPPSFLCVDPNYRALNRARFLT